MFKKIKVQKIAKTQSKKIINCSLNIFKKKQKN